MIPSVRDLLHQKAPWLQSPHIRPYVYVRPENQIQKYGTRHRVDWFQSPIVSKHPLSLDELEFAEQIYYLEGSAFGPAGMAMPRWVFYDCAVMPGLCAGFAYRTSELPEALRKVMRHDPKQEWTPISLFIIIPTMHRGEWVAHNLCSINSILLDRKDHFYALGFLTKAFGLWYANVEQCSGMTQWGGPALKLHSHYGHLEMVGAYAPVHSHAKTVTYRTQVSASSWEKFFTREEDLSFLERCGPTGEMVDPRDEKSMIHLQRRIEKGEGPFFLSAAEISQKQLHEPLNIFKLKENFG